MCHVNLTHKNIIKYAHTRKHTHTHTDPIFNNVILILFSRGISRLLIVELTSDTLPIFLASKEKDFSKLSCKFLWCTSTSSLVWNFSLETEHLQFIIFSCPFRWFCWSRYVTKLCSHKWTHLKGDIFSSHFSWVSLSHEMQVRNLLFRFFPITNLLPHTAHFFSHRFLPHVNC